MLQPSGYFSFDVQNEGQELRKESLDCVDMQLFDSLFSVTAFVCRGPGQH
jgi:hypothetical protein